MSLTPLIFNQVHGAGVKVFKGQSVAKTIDVPSSGSYAHGFVFSDRAIKVGEQVCIQIIEQSEDSKLRLGFTKTNPDSFPKSLLGHYNKATIQTAECWVEAVPQKSLKSNTKIIYSVNKGGDLHFEINGVDKGLIEAEIETKGQLWAVIDLAAHDVQVQAIGVKPIYIKPSTPIPMPVTKIVETPKQSAEVSPTSFQKQKKTSSVKIQKTTAPKTKNRFDLMSDSFDGETEDLNEKDLNDSTKGPRLRSQGKKSKKKGKSGGGDTAQEEDESSHAVIFIVVVIVVLSILVLTTFIK